MIMDFFFSKNIYIKFRKICRKLYIQIELESQTFTHVIDFVMLRMPGIKAPS